MVRGPLTLFVLIFVAGAASSGCGLYRPALGEPRTTQQQQYSAVLHDPYADQDLGPAVVGGRPREFQRPLAEPVRQRMFADSWWGR